MDTNRYLPRRQLVIILKTIRFTFVHCGFSLDHYRECIELAKSLEYKIGPAKMVLDDPQRFILLRHDVDFYLDYAVQLAEFEASLGVSSTYFILLHSPFYNVLAPKSMEQLHKIAKLGHEIGWHVDKVSFDYDERRILQDIIKQDVTSFSWHLPDEKTPKQNPYFMTSCKDINRDYDIKYISDSGMNWRESCMCQWIGKVERLQILTHPLWWTHYGEVERNDVIDIMGHRIKVNMLGEITKYKYLVKEYLNKLGVTY